MDFKLFVTFGVYHKFKNLYINIKILTGEYQVCLYDKGSRGQDNDQLGKWARKWGMRFQPVKCNNMQLTRKLIKKINAVYSLEGTVLENVDNTCIKW